MSASPGSGELPAVDWALAGRVAGRLCPAGPTTTRAEAAAAVAELARAAATAEEPVRTVTGLAADAPVAAALVVDRPRWARAAALSMGSLTGTDAGRPGLAGRVAAVQAGAVLGLLSSAVLGQYDPFTAGGTLLLVAPNVVAVERSLRLRPADFRLWVCLHEVTHRVQFTATPWLADHLAAQVATLTRTDDAGDTLGRLAGAVRRGGTGDGVVGLLRASQAPEQQQALDRLLALGTLLEGHADHVMDAVGPAVVPTVARIRRAFDARRRRPGNPVQRVLRTLLGVDAKLAQYVRGKAFVDHVVQRVGMEAFNVVWSGPDALPVDAEIADPDRWVRRVLA